MLLSGAIRLSKYKTKVFCKIGQLPKNSSTTVNLFCRISGSSKVSGFEKWSCNCNITAYCAASLYFFSLMISYKNVDFITQQFKSKV